MHLGIYFVCTYSSGQTYLCVGLTKLSWCVQDSPTCLEIHLGF